MNMTPFNLIMGYIPHAEWPTKPSRVSSLKAQMEELEKARDQALQKIGAVQKVMKLWNKGNKIFKPYKESNQVWIEGTNLKTIYLMAKLGPKRYGPFKILKQLSEAIYQVEIPRQWKIHNVFHANLIMPYKETELHGPNFT